MLEGLTVEDLENVIKSLPEDYQGVGIDSIRSWRGSYDEPAFTLSHDVSKKQMLKVVKKCLNEVFRGYKGGDYRYYINSPCNFDEYGVYSAGRYIKNWLHEYEGSIFLTGLAQICTLGKLKKINKFEPIWVNPPYRDKLVKGGGIRCGKDFTRIGLHLRSKYNHAHLIAHQECISNNVILEIHDPSDENGDEGENCRMECFHLSNQQRYELAIYLLGTVDL